MEPSFIAQSAGPIGLERAADWYRTALAEAKKRGATFFRMSHHSLEPSKLLCEAWLEAPEDQGPLRWDHPEAVKLA